MIPNKPNSYLAYKKSKLTTPVIQEKKKISKFSFICQLFLATFVFIFIIIVFVIMRYSQKMDIEYSKNELIQQENETSENLVSYDNENQGKIDKRLILLQQEENAPSEAKLTEKKKEAEIIDPKLIEESKKIEKIEKEKEAKKNHQTDEASKDETKPSLKGLLDEVKKTNTHELKPAINTNIQTIMSKVLIGKYATLEEAQAAQVSIKANNSNLSPYVKKIGEIYAVQTGSYQDFNVAKVQAQNLKSKGYEVWIYQQ